MRFPWLVLILAVQVGPPLAAQAGGSPLRFAVAWTGASSRGDLAELADNPAGFTAQLSLPLTRSSPLGIRGEFSVLTFPERVLTVPGGFQDAELEVAARGTIGFTGAGPRLEARSGPFALAGAVMGGFVRMITDVTGRATVDGVRSSASISESDYAFAFKALIDGHLALYRGVQGTTIGLVTGVDFLRGGRVTFPALGTMRMANEGVITIDRPGVVPEVITVRLGVGVEF
ncbi:MAG TPA: hypothetical protein PLL69_08360 [Gemmatimonadales bacterium]|nr:hypothetical protein [Gemmatimonadales bacterium]